MQDIQASGEVFTSDNRINLYYLNELYGKIADHVAQRMRDLHKIDVPITSGVWGGTYLIADKFGKSLRRIWRLYCLVNLPQNSPLDKHSNLEKLVEQYARAITAAFKPWGLSLELKMWGGRLPHSNRLKPNITMHFEDRNEKVRWLRPIIVWNEATWEQSVIYDSVRLVKELKQNLDYDKGPTLTDPQEIKYLLQDVIITYRTLEQAHSADFVEHAEPIIKDMVGQFLNGLHNPMQIRDLYHTVLSAALVYGYEQTLDTAYRTHGLDVRQVEDWPTSKINWVPVELQEKLIPPIQKIFATFRANLDRDGNGSGRF